MNTVNTTLTQDISGLYILHVYNLLFFKPKKLNFLKTGYLPHVTLSEAQVRGSWESEAPGSQRLDLKNMIDNH